MTPEQKKRILETAAFLSIDTMWYHINLCADEGIYYSDEESGEQYFEEYDDIDLYNIELYKLQKIEITE